MKERGAAGLADDIIGRPSAANQKAIRGAITCNRVMSIWDAIGAGVGGDGNTGMPIGSCGELGGALGGSTGDSSEATPDDGVGSSIAADGGAGSATGSWKACACGGIDVGRCSGRWPSAAMTGVGGGGSKRELPAAGAPPGSLSPPPAPTRAEAGDARPRGDGCIGGGHAPSRGAHGSGRGAEAARATLVTSIRALLTSVRAAGSKKGTRVAPS